MTCQASDPLPKNMLVKQSDCISSAVRFYPVGLASGLTWPVKNPHSNATVSHLGLDYRKQKLRVILATSSSACSLQQLFASGKLFFIL